jgi:soluble lytic murein transglycosylase-like protein
MANADWLKANDGPLWVPALNAAEVVSQIPHNLLARIAYEESSFLPEVIDGSEVSPAGCIGIMQLNPKYFPNAGISPDADIEDAAQLLESLYVRFNDWQVAIAAYNWGGGNVHHEYAVNADHYILADMPGETQRYVKQVCADVPVPGVLLR